MINFSARRIKLCPVCMDIFGKGTKTISGNGYIYTRDIVTNPLVEKE